MKKILFAVIAGSISMLASTSGAVAQTSNKVKLLETHGDVVDINKLILTLDKTISPDNINTRTLKNFKKDYKDAPGVKWVKDDQLITAEFSSNGIETVVYYNTKGRWLGSIKNYNEEKFDPKVRSIVKSTYYDYKIDYIQEVETIDTYGMPTYLAYIQDDADFKVIRIGDDIMDVYQQFKKQK